MGSQRSLLKSVTTGVAGKRHYCKGNKNHEILKGDRILLLKIERNVFHYCAACTLSFIATAQNNLATLEAEIQSAQ
ncbi:hypothetical protein [Rhodococcus sp. ARC_M6]|jgi:hypothetical protein|uniref:hypothetical protein n=1 Tax=Rhodococcus sp. ARC_M6 TaxID=2928852 RepID=UPI001FB4EDC0|nr:hypothetical protein [Rhodococcus sp. ARC_M6]MCJ0907427.1 hypothetical protein [Rhodococcus sp. ARC_M6]